MEGYVFKGSDAVVEQASSLKFGLNKDAVLNSLTYTTDCRGENSTAELPVEAIDMKFMFGEKEFNHRIMPPKGTYVNKKGQPSTLDDSVAGVKKALTAQVIDPLAHLMEALGVGIPAIQAAITSLFNGKPLVFSEIANVFIKLLPKTYATTKLDIFLQYEGSLGANATRTYLKMAKDLRSGLFIVPAMEGVYSEIRKVNAANDDAKALSYTREDGASHRFIRNGYFMQSNAAKMLTNGTATPEANPTASAEVIAGLQY